MQDNVSIENKRILLHACCGPCSLGAIEPLLSEGGSVSLFYYNPCIIDGEFEKRYFAVKTVADHYGIELITPPHDYSAYINLAVDFSDEREGGERCGLCMGERMRSAAEYAKAHGFDMFSTTLTVSPHKNSKKIFALAADIERTFGVPFLYRDFKKRDGFKRSCILSAELGIYRQRFCGCEFSAVGAGIDVAEYSDALKSEYSSAGTLSGGLPW